MEKSPFSLRLISLRKACNMTQEELAVAIGINRSTYTCYEIGTSMPTIATLIAIADVLEVSTDYLLGRTEKPTEERMDDTVSLVEERQVVEMYRRMSESHRHLVMSIMKEF